MYYIINMSKVPHFSVFQCSTLESICKCTRQHIIRDSQRRVQHISSAMLQETITFQNFWWVATDSGMLTVKYLGLSVLVSLGSAFSQSYSHVATIESHIGLLSFETKERLSHSNRRVESQETNEVLSWDYFARPTFHFFYHLQTSVMSFEMMIIKTKLL